MPTRHSLAQTKVLSPTCLGRGTAAPWRCRLQHSVHPDPAHKGFKPTCARRFLRIHPEAMATLFIKMDFDWVLRCLPAIDEPIATVREERIVGSKGDE